jgi:hypothetical protein
VRLAIRTLDWQRKSGASPQQHSQESTGENIEGKAETRPPRWYAQIFNDQVMKEIENSMSGERGDN